MDAFIVRRGGGGNPLNFTVIGGTMQPENPKENTIWVNTPNEVTGWIVSPSQPENPSEGLVWVKTDSDYGVEFALTEESTFIIYVLEISIYASGEWHICEAQAYISEEWMDVAHTKYLYKPGDQCVDQTGGWVLTYDNGSVELEFTASHIKMRKNATDHLRISTNTPVLLTGYKTLFVEAYVYYGIETYYGIQVGLSGSKLTQSDTTAGSLVATNSDRVVGVTVLLSLDISSYVSTNPSAYINIKTVGRSEYHIYRVWLE